MTKGVVINPREVIRWQAATCKVGAILDVPPIDSRGNRFFEEGLAGTLSNIKVALPFYREQRAAGTAFRWWGVVQGWTTQELQRWWEQVSRVYPFTDEGEGWALKPRPNITPTSTARVLRFVAQHPEIKRIHLLATTGVGAVATLITLGAASGLELASYDSTTFILMAINRGLLKIDEDGLGWSNESERGGERQLRDYLLETCQCAACTQLRDEVDRYDDLLHKNEAWSAYWVFRFAYHNLLCMLEVFSNVRRESATHGDAVLDYLLGENEAANVRWAFERHEAFDHDAGKPHTLLDWAT